ncbi:SDR family NAD(P)-dependent oxidoreductase [Acidicapsa ligni]|uniref:SDR family NAD(P)-dependent oxidoreductase n=1 Tax=Acidicapsa ligni TaxID=542300 RepID=UPI0021E0A017|nr:SDR family NAD(P)-dependent oxidoreductase [Acidicapsa ligni]
MKIDISGWAVLVTGGTGGLGSAISLAFLEEGAKVITTYRNENEFASLKNAAGINQSALEGYPVDVTDEAAANALINTILAKHGKLDALVNAVGGYSGGVKLWDASTKVFDQMLALNLRSVYALSRAVLPSMLKASHGSIVNISAKAALDHGAGAGAYAASKAAALALTDSLAGDTKGTGVRVNSILPSIIDTNANRLAMPGSNFADWPKPEDIAKVVLFLCSDASKVIHGAAVPVYGNS